MNQQSEQDIERRSRALYDESVDNLDMRTRSRLTQARHTALAAAEKPSPLRWLAWTPVYGAVAAVVLGVALWIGHSGTDRMLASADSRSGLEDLELVASNDQLELLQDDIEFYDWIDKSAANDSAGAG
jgi:hypothetical protein